MTRRTVGSMIVVAWVGSLGWLGARHVFSAEDRALTRAAARIGPSTSFYAVLLGETQVGTAGLTIDTLPTGFRLLETIAVDVPASGNGPGRLMHNTEAQTTRSFRVRQASTVIGRRGAVTQTLDLVPGPDTTIVLRLALFPRGSEVITAFPGPSTVLVATLPFQLASLDRLRPGAALGVEAAYPARLRTVSAVARVQAESTFAVSDTAVVDPGTGRWVEVDAQPVTAWRVERGGGGPPMVDWVDGQGRVIRREHPLGVVLERSPFEVNFTNYQVASREGTQVVPERIAAARSLTFASERPDTTANEVAIILRRLDRPVPAGSLEFLTGGRQTVAGDTVRIRRHGIADGTSPRPPRERNMAGLTPADRGALENALGTAMTTRRGPDTLAALVRWVAQDVLYVTGPGTPIGAARTLRSNRGGPEGKALLLAALAEAAGFTARVVGGVDLSRGDLPVHTWVEVWRDGWVAVDPTFGHFPASPWLLRVVEGAGRPQELVLHLGALSAERLPAAGAENAR